MINYERNNKAPKSSQKKQKLAKWSIITLSSFSTDENEIYMPNHDIYPIEHKANVQGKYKVLKLFEKNIPSEIKNNNFLTFSIPPGGEEGKSTISVSGSPDPNFPQKYINLENNKIYTKDSEDDGHQPGTEDPDKPGTDPDNPDTSSCMFVTDQHKKILCSAKKIPILHKSTCLPLMMRARVSTILRLIRISPA